MKQLLDSSPATGPIPADFRASLFGHPDDVLSSPDLSPAEKRALLASWISDARAVENAPALRRLDNGATVSLDDILQALKSLDIGDGSAEHHRLPPVARRKLKGKSVPDWLRRAIRLDHFDDDDNPPSAPAAAAVPPRLRLPKTQPVRMLRHAQP